LLREATEELAKSPLSLDAAIWVGRRTAYLGRFQEAIELYSKALAKHPDSPHLLRHRGHRWITVRELDRAIDDLSRAAALVRGKDDEIEPDGLPNERGVPTSSLQTNIFYHLGLAHYLRGDFEPALAAYRECLAVSKNPDMQVATTYWLYLTLLRLERTEAAAAALEPIERAMDLIENHDYHRLLIGYKHHEGVHELWEEASKNPKAVQYATVAYGMGAYHLASGRPEKAHTWFERALDSPNWTAFGVVAAEAELARAPAGGS
jgi:tetratricopeptide (TPR) repeat protein